MVPMKHYIPLAQDLHDLKRQLGWIQDNPAQVRAIAERGHQFYLDYLSFERNEQHIYEFVHQLSLAKQRFDQSVTSQKLKRIGRRQTRKRRVAIETVSVPNDKKGNIDELQVMCKELIARAGNATKGNEPWRNDAGPELLWNMSDCNHQADSVLGNHLSRWYMIRAVASDAGIAVKLNRPSSIMDRIQTKVLPFDTILDDDEQFSWKKFCQSCEKEPGNCIYPLGMARNGLERVRSAIRSDLRTMAYNVLLADDKNKFVNELDDVTIHLRVGDIGQQDHALYGLVPFKVYKELIPGTVKSIGIVSAPFTKHHLSWGPGDPGLNEAIATAARDYLQDSFPNATVTTRSSEDETLEMIYTRLIVTNMTICGPSAFCLFPAIASLRRSYILQSPLFGGSRSWIRKVVRDFHGVHYIKRKYCPITELYKLNTTTIVGKLRG